MVGIDEKYNGLNLRETFCLGRKTFFVGDRLGISWIELERNLFYRKEDFLFRGKMRNFMD